MELEIKNSWRTSLKMSFMSSSRNYSGENLRSYIRSTVRFLGIHMMMRSNLGAAGRTAIRALERIAGLNRLAALKLEPFGIKPSISNTG